MSFISLFKYEISQQYKLITNECKLIIKKISKYLKNEYLSNEGLTLISGYNYGYKSSAYL